MNVATIYWNESMNYIFITLRILTFFFLLTSSALSLVTWHHTHFAHPCVTAMCFSADANERRGNEEARNNLPVSVPVWFVPRFTADPILRAKRWRESALLQFCLQKWSTFWFLSSSRLSESTMTSCKWVKISGNLLHHLKDWAKSEGWWELRPWTEAFSTSRALTSSHWRRNTLLILALFVHFGDTFIQTLKKTHV